MEVLRKFDVPSVDQVIAVPRISFDRVPQRSAVRRPQKAEQLVEVPTEPGCALAVIATKALGWRAAAALAEQIVDNPVRQGRWGSGGGLHGSRARQNSTAADVEQIVDFPAPEVFKVFAQARFPQLSHRVGCLTTQMMEFNGFFAPFPRSQKVRR